MLTGLTETQCQTVDRLLMDLLVQSESEAVFLCNRGGYILAESLMRDFEQNDNIAALAAGSFYATREIARLVGEPEFRCVFHQGDRKGIYMQNTRSDLLMVVVFGKESNPGLTKLCTEEIVKRLDACLEASDSSLEEDPFQSMKLEINPDERLFVRAKTT